MRTDLPSGQDVAELAVELANRGLDLREAEPPARDPGLVGDDEDQMIAYWAELLGHAGQQLDHDFAVGAERKLAGLVHLHQRPRQVEEQSAISIRILAIVDIDFGLRSVAPVDVVADVGENLVEDLDAGFGLLVA